MFSTQPHDDWTLALALLVRTYGTHRLKVYDDSWGEVYVYGYEFGPTQVIRAQSWEAAYDIAIDESPTIGPSVLPEAFGFYIPEHEGKYYLCSDHDEYGVKTIVSPEWPRHRVISTHPDREQAREAAMRLVAVDGISLVEGYVYQSNFTGTGIVNEGHYAWLQSLDGWNAQRPEQRVMPVFVP